MTTTEGDVCAGTIVQPAACLGPAMQRIFPDEDSATLA